MTAKHRLAIFDLDGTLIEYEMDFFVDESLRIIHELGYTQITASDLRRYAAQNDLFAFVPQKDRVEFSHEFHIRFDEKRQPPARPIEGALQTMESLASHGLELAICTARATLPHEVEEALHHTGFNDHLSIISTRGQVVREWGDKSGQLRELCRELKIGPEDSFMVGDNPIDITSAKKVGVDVSVAVLTGGISRDVLAQTAPDFILDDISVLLDHFPFHRKSK